MWWPTCLLAVLASQQPAVSSQDFGVVVTGARFIAFVGDDGFTVSSPGGGGVFLCRRDGCAPVEASAGAQRRARGTSPHGHALSVALKIGRGDPAQWPYQVVVDAHPSVAVVLPFSRGPVAPAVRDVLWSDDGLAVGLSASDAQGEPVAVVVELASLWPSGAMCCQHASAPGPHGPRPQASFAELPRSTLLGFSDDGAAFFVATKTPGQPQRSICTISETDGSHCAPLSEAELAAPHSFSRVSPKHIAIVRDEYDGGGLLSVRGADGKELLSFHRPFPTALEDVMWRKDGRYAAVYLRHPSGARDLVILDLSLL